MSDNAEHNCLDNNKLVADIEEFGWEVILIEATEYLPSFAYTIGLWKNYNHPEIISFGLTTKTLHLILNTAGDMVKSGQVIKTTKVYDDFFENSKTAFIGIDKRNLGDYFGTAINFYNSKEFPALQLIWTDRNDNFPWDPDYQEEFQYRQPLLDRNADFKFRESKNLAVFTTRQFIEMNKPILDVIHENDGDWQFLTGDQFIEDIKIVGLNEMVSRDQTLNEVFNLEFGERASREFIGSEWTRVDRTEEETDN